VEGPDWVVNLAQGDQQDNQVLLDQLDHGENRERQDRQVRIRINKIMKCSSIILHYLWLYY
jgi:hypothetical protein